MSAPREHSDYHNTDNAGMNDLEETMHFNGTWGPRAHIKVWRNGAWVPIEDAKPLPTAVGIPAKYLRLGFTVYKGGVVGSLWLCGLPSHSEPHFIAATAQWRNVWPLEDDAIVCPRGYTLTGEHRRGIRIEELGKHDGYYVKPERTRAA